MKELAYLVMDEYSNKDKFVETARVLKDNYPHAKVFTQYKSPNMLPESKQAIELRVAVIDGESDLYLDPQLPDTNMTYVIVGGSSKFRDPNARLLSKDATPSDIADTVVNAWHDTEIRNARADFQQENQNHYAIDGLGRVGSDIARQLLYQDPENEVLIVDRRKSLNKDGKKRFEAGLRQLSYSADLSRTSDRINVVDINVAMEHAASIYITSSDRRLRKKPMSERVHHYVVNSKIIDDLVSQDMAANDFSALPFWFPITNYNFMLALDMQEATSGWHFQPRIYVPPGGDVFRIKDGLASALVKFKDVDPELALQLAKKSDVTLTGTHMNPKIRNAKIPAFNGNQGPTELNKLLGSQQIASINSHAQRRADDSFIRQTSPDLVPGLIDSKSRLEQRKKVIFGAFFLVNPTLGEIIYWDESRRGAFGDSEILDLDNTYLACKYAQFSADNLGELKLADEPYTDPTEIRREINALEREHRLHQKYYGNINEARVKILKQLRRA